MINEIMKCFKNAHIFLTFVYSDHLLKKKKKLNNVISAIK